MNNNSYCLKNCYQLTKYFNKLKNIADIVTYDFTGLFKNINLNDLNHIINSLFKKYYFKLKLPNNVAYDYFQTLKFYN